MTLVELVVSMAVLAVLIVGMGSAILIASHALPSRDDPTEKVIQTSEVVNDIAAELREARHIVERAANAITFTVADRDVDGAPERIRYEWLNAANASGPLTRQYNDGTAVNILEDVHQFDLGYDLKAVTEDYPGPPVEGPEILLSSYTQSDELRDYKVERNNWIGQYFNPSDVGFPADAISWRVTRVRFLAKDEGPGDEDTFVQLRPADADNKPTDTILEQRVMHEEDLSGSHAWKDFSFANVAGLAPGEGLCLVLQHQGSGGGSAKIRYDNRGNLGATGRLKTADQGSSWGYSTDKSMLYEVYGKMTTPGPNQTATRQYVTGIQLTLQTGDDAALRFDTGVSLLNTPELLSAVWQADFNSDPTLDHNGDEEPDWIYTYGDNFDMGSMTDGVWYADTELRTYPDNDFAELTTVAVRFRHTDDDEVEGAEFRINADVSDDMFSPILAFLQLQLEGTQTLTISTKSDSSTVIPLDSFPGLTSGFVDLQLLIDPDLDTVSVTVDEVHRGTYHYAQCPFDESFRYASIGSTGGDAQFDDVSIRVGGNNP